MARIFVVDDEVELVKLFRLILEKKGHEVIGAYDGREALERIAEVQPDVLLVDTMMPDMGGNEVIRHLRANGTWAQLPIVIMTAGTNMIEPEVQAMDKVVVMMKPIRPADLVEVVAGLVG